MRRLPQDFPQASSTSHHLRPLHCLYHISSLQARASYQMSIFSEWGDACLLLRSQCYKQKTNCSNWLKFKWVLLAFWAFLTENGQNLSIFTYLFSFQNSPPFLTTHSLNCCCWTNACYIWNTGKTRVKIGRTWRSTHVIFHLLKKSLVLVKNDTQRKKSNLFLFLFFFLFQMKKKIIHDWLQTSQG